jgi:hypothetical protein
LERHKIDICPGYRISRRTLPDPNFTTMALLPPAPAVNPDYGLSILQALRQDASH